VCRMEFDAGECVQCLPACGHVYHEVGRCTLNQVDP
jgi:hypothetical protein